MIRLSWLCTVQVDRDTQTVVCDDQLEDTSVEELRDSLPEHQPRSLFPVPVSVLILLILFFLLGSCRSDLFERKMCFMHTNIESVVDYGTFIILSRASRCTSLSGSSVFLESVLLYIFRVGSGVFLELVLLFHGLFLDPE
jgi:hypothetical protein